MSLAQHVTQAEGFDNERPLASESDRRFLIGSGQGEVTFGISQSDETGTSDNGPQWRPLRYSLAESINQEKPIAAYEISRARRLVQVMTGIIACWFAAGIVFGFAALKPVLVAEGVYSDLCCLDDVGADCDNNGGNHGPCNRQDMRLNLFFIVASVTANVGSLVAGTVLDRSGRRTCWVLSSVCLAMGSLLMASARRVPGIDPYLVGNILLALGGAFVFVSSFQLADAFPKHRGLIIALVTGAFDASAAVFLIYRVIYEATGYSLDKFFFTYISVPALIALAEISYMPVGPYHTTPQLVHEIERAQDETRDIHDSDDEMSDSGELTRIRSARADRRVAELHKMEDIAGDAYERGARAKSDEAIRETSDVWGVLHGVPAHLQMKTPWFTLIFLLTSIIMLRMNFFIATIRAQYRYMLDSDKHAYAINHFFDGALPIGGLLATPFIGLLLNNVTGAKTFSVLTVFSVALGVLNCLPFVWAGYATATVFSIFRPFYYSAVSDYAAKVFGFATFGRIYGTILCASGLINFAQLGFDALVHGPLQENPTPVNIVLSAAGGVAGASLTLFIAAKGHTVVNRSTPALEGAEERQRLLPNSRTYRFER